MAANLKDEEERKIRIFKIECLESNSLSNLKK